MKEEPILLHIDLGNQSLSNWLRENKYVIFSELVRYSEKMIKLGLESIQAIMVSNLSDNVVFIIQRKDLQFTLDKAMDYFLSMEEYEKCAEIRDLYILIENLKNETENIEIGKPNKRQSKRGR
jgi:hypothetical protein